MVDTKKSVAPRRTRLKNVLINLGLFAGVSIAGLLVFEVVVRLIEPKPVYDQRDNEFAFYEYDRRLGWRNRPGASGTFFMPDSKSEVLINSVGMRDPEHEIAKPEGVHRVQFYGDSFTWGYGVDVPERMTQVFERELQGASAVADESGAERRYEVMNFGTTGYGTDQEYLLLQRDGLAYAPDLVVLMYHNDVGDVGRKVAYTYPRPFFEVRDGELELTNVPVPKRDHDWTKRFEIKRTGLVYTINRALKVSHAWAFTKRRLMAFDSIRDRVYAQPSYHATLEIIDAVILATDELVRGNDAQFVLVLIPDKSQIYGNSNTIEIDHLNTFAPENGIHVIDLLPELRRLAGEGEDLYFEIDGHFSPRGNELVGKLLFERMREAGFFSGRG